MDHVVELGHHQVVVADHRVVDRVALGFLDVTNPFAVVADRVDGQADHLGIALVELGLELGHVTQLSGADRSEVLRVGEQDGPLIADPLVEVDRAFGGFGGEIGRFITNADCHVYPPFWRLVRLPSRQRESWRGLAPCRPISIGRHPEAARRRGGQTKPPD
ncbi:hypothetical protein D9M71_311030 [compost metagenome]